MTSPAPPDDPIDPDRDATPAPMGLTYVAPVPALGTSELSGTFGRYRIVRRLGQGGMGCVYLAHDSQLDRPIALKVPQFEAGDHSMLRERFYREARAAANLRHPNICPVHDIGAVEDVPYLTMTFIDGKPLHEWAGSPRPMTELIAVIRKIAEALAEAHRAGVVHRDLKPSNILIDSRDEPIVMDFGLARRLHLEEKDRLTSPGLIVGTPGYMSPEQALGLIDASGPTCDVYSLGVILYELVCGRMPFVGSSLVVLTQVVRDDPAPPSSHRPDLGQRFDAVCLRALARDAGRRYPDMTAFARALGELRSDLDSRPLVATPTTPPTQIGPGLVEKGLDLLRRWGFSRAVQKIRGLSQNGEEVQRRGFQTLYEWLTRDDGPLTTEARPLRGWAMAGQASRLLRDHMYADALRLLERARAADLGDEPMLAATIAHTHGTALVHLGRFEAALPNLHRALEGFGREHFMTGRVLDTLGTAYASKGNFPIAREFYEQSLQFKRRFDDDSGIAVSHGQLGRLFLDWGQLDEAEEHFRHDLELAQRMRSKFSEAQMCNHLGQVALARGEREAASGKRAAMRRHYGNAAGWLTQSIEIATSARHTVSVGFARKDMALLALREGDLDRAGEHAGAARSLFHATGFKEGIAKVQYVMGMILRERGNFAEAESRLREALEHFEGTNEAKDATRTVWELARVQRDRKAPHALVSRAYEIALERAEGLRHDPLVRSIEREFHDVDAEGYLRHMYRRARGFDIDHDDPSLMEGDAKAATLLFVDLPGFNEFTQGMNPQSILVTFNHLIADFADVLERHRGRVMAYRGSGLMGLMRDARHEERAVDAALDLVAALEAFNRPRQVLGQAVFHVRIGIASGEVLLGNVGTYVKMDFTAIGAAVNIAGALRNEARFGVPCISRATYEVVRSRFDYESPTPRSVTVSGYGTVDVWDVRGRRG